MPEEHSAIGELTVGVYRHLRGGPVGEYEAQLRDVTRRARHGEVYVAVDVGGALLGTVTFAAHPSEYAQVTDPGEAEFRMLAVAPVARRAGVGRALVETCVVRARALGCRVLRLSTDPTMVDAHRLYEAMGFVRTPDRDWSPRPSVDLRTYALDL